MPYNPSQLLQFARGAGFQGNDAHTMAAIMMAESSGDPTAHNQNAQTGDNSYGLAQINMIGNLGPARLKQFGLKNASQLFDPATNVKAAKTVKDSSGFGAWSTYGSGAYKKFLPDVQKAAAGLPNTPATPTNTNQQTGNVYNIYLNDQSRPDGNQFLDNYKNYLLSSLNARPTFNPLSLIQNALFQTPNYFGDDSSPT